MKKLFFVSLLLPLMACGTNSISSVRDLQTSTGWQTVERCDDHSTLDSTMSPLSGPGSINVQQFVTRNASAIQYLAGLDAFDNYNYDPYSQGEAIFQQPTYAETFTADSLQVSPNGVVLFSLDNSALAPQNLATRVYRIESDTANQTLTLRVFQATVINSLTGQPIQTFGEPGTFGSKPRLNGELGNWVFRGCK